MTFIQPNKTKNLLNGLLVLSASRFLRASFGMVALYNATVNLTTILPATKAELDAVGAQNTTLNNKIIASLSGDNLTAVAAAGRACRRSETAVFPGEPIGEPIMAYRFALLITILVAAYFLLAFHLYRVAGDERRLLLRKGAGRSACGRERDAATAARFISPIRTAVLLPAALEQEFPVIYAVPSAIADVQEAANTVAPILGMPVGTLEKIFSKSERPVRTFGAEGGSLGRAGDHRPRTLKECTPTLNRAASYPLGTVASQVLGYVGPNATTNGESGHYGIEGYYDSTLADGGRTIYSHDRPEHPDRSGKNIG